MKKLVLAAMFALTSVWAFNSPLAAQGLIARPVAAVILDLSKPLPTEVNLTVGQNLVVQNGPAAKVTVVETDGKGELLQARPHNTFNQTAAYTAKRAGSGELTITYTVQAPGHKPMRPVTLKVNVKKLVPAPVVVPMHKALPVKLTLEKGQQVSFKIKGTEEAVFTITSSSKLLKVGAATPANGTIKSFDAVDVGTAEIEVVVTTDLPGAKPRTYKIIVEIVAP